VRERVSHSGWAEQPPIRDLARLHFSRSTCQISGAYVPVAEMNLHRDDGVYFSHHVLLHADPGVRMNPMKMTADWNRKQSGMPLVMMTADGPGRIAFSDDCPGEIVAVPLQHNQAVDVLTYRFLTVTKHVRYSWHKSGIWFTTWNDQNQVPDWHYPVGRMLDRFFAQDGPGLLLLHAPGNTFIRDLADGERILIRPGAFLWKDPTVRMSLHFEYPGGSYWFASAQWQAKTTWLVLHGPGRIAMASVFRHPPLSPAPMNDSGATYQSW
jgi:uncharacterized protein (AIM24 family)